MEIVEALSRQYAFTLRRTNLKKPVSSEDYYKHLEKWTTTGKCQIQESVFEYEGGIHMHGIMEIRKDVNFKHFRVRGWNIKLEELYDVDGWRHYMLKHQKAVQDLESYIEDGDTYNLKTSLFKRATASDV